MRTTSSLLLCSLCLGATCLVAALAACAAEGGVADAAGAAARGEEGAHATAVARPSIAHLGRPGGDAAGVRALAAEFARRNPGYGLRWLPAVSAVPAIAGARILFVQDGGDAAEVDEGGVRTQAAVAVGDLVVLRGGASCTFATPLGVLEFSLPDRPGDEVPTFVRPDWDPRITDTPGGCATETGAYRRILLTWRRENGPYTYRGLNAHRVRIADSFTHYHPVVGGFDEFYLVQMVQPGARLLTSGAVDRIERREVAADESRTLLDEHPLAVGDLVYLPRGLAHRGLGGVLAQVITVPGFVPGAEIGIDHHLRAIDERLGGGVVPFHLEASAGPVVR